MSWSVSSCSTHQYGGWHRTCLVLSPVADEARTERWRCQDHHRVQSVATSWCRSSWRWRRRVHSSPGCCHSCTLKTPTSREKAIQETLHADLEDVVIMMMQMSTVLQKAHTNTAWSMHLRTRRANVQMTHNQGEIGKKCDSYISQIGTQSILCLMFLMWCDGFFLTSEDFGRMLDHSFPACVFFLFRFFIKWRWARACQFHSLCQDQSTVA